LNRSNTFTVFIESNSVLCVEKGDILFFAAGIITVIVIAILVNPQSISGILPQVPVATPLPEQSRMPLPVQTIITPTYEKATPVPHPAEASLYRIYYSEKPFSYPRLKLPENMENFGASDILQRNMELVPFAFIEEKRGGLTQKFTIPYPLWVLNISVVANISPQYGNFRMLLCNASDGTIIEGVEILNRGNAYRVIQISNTELYMIISATSVDVYRITFETPRTYYDAYHPQ
jgi:hypothetical protein